MALSGEVQAAYLWQDLQLMATKASGTAMERHTLARAVNTACIHQSKGRATLSLMTAES